MLFCLKIDVKKAKKKFLENLKYPPASLGHYRARVLDVEDTKIPVEQFAVSWVDLDSNPLRMIEIQILCPIGELLSSRLTSCDMQSPG